MIAGLGVGAGSGADVGADAGAGLGAGKVSCLVKSLRFKGWFRFR